MPQDVTQKLYGWLCGRKVRVNRISCVPGFEDSRRLRPVEVKWNDFGDRTGAGGYHQQTIEAEGVA